MRRVLKEGKIIFADGMRVIDCTIRDLSEEGARLLIVNTVGVPEAFDLFENSTGMVYAARLAWRQWRQVRRSADEHPRQGQQALRAPAVHVSGTRPKI
jgi:hypothetical protein